MDDEGIIQILCHAIRLSEISFMGPHWPRELQEEPVLLLLDGHPSRWDFKANLIFYCFNVNVLTFAGHCSHLMRAFDVGIASPLKMALKQLLSAATFEQFLAEPTFESLSTARKTTMTEIRCFLIGEIPAFAIFQISG